MYDAKAAAHGYDVSAETIRQFADYVEAFHAKYRQHTGGLASFIVVSSRFANSATSRRERSDQLYDRTNVKLAFLTSAALAGICQILGQTLYARSALPWRQLLTRLDIEPEAIRTAGDEVQRDEVID
jgi:hypothetical protein